MTKDARGEARHEKEQNENDCDRIRTLNDKLRRTGQGGRQFITAGIQELGMEAVIAIRAKIARFDCFTADNDPYGEHDFGSVSHQGETVFWKIDYYDRTLTWHSPDPSDAAVTERVLTIMLASEY